MSTVPTTIALTPFSYVGCCVANKKPQMPGKVCLFARSCSCMAGEHTTHRTLSRLTRCAPVSRQRARCRPAHPPHVGLRVAECIGASPLSYTEAGRHSKQPEPPPHLPPCARVPLTPHSHLPRAARPTGPLDRCACATTATHKGDVAIGTGGERVGPAKEAGAGICWQKVPHGLLLLNALSHAILGCLSLECRKPAPTVLPNRCPHARLDVRPHAVVF